MSWRSNDMNAKLYVYIGTEQASKWQQGETMDSLLFHSYNAAPKEQLKC